MVTEQVNRNFVLTDILYHSFAMASRKTLIYRKTSLIECEIRAILYPKFLPKVGNVMESVWIALEIVAPLFLMMAVGYIVKLTHIMNETSVRQTNKLIFNVFLPLLVFQNIYNTELQTGFDSWLLIYAISGVILQFLIALCIVVITEHDNSKRGVMLQGMFRSNFVLFGIPICTALFGGEAAGLASVLIAVIIPMYNILAVISLEIFNGGRPNILKTLIGIVTNPLIIASVAAILCVSFNISLPNVVTITISNLAGIATPLAFVVLGASFAFKEIGGCVKSLSITLAVKLLFFPVLFLGLAVLLGFRGPSLAVLLTVFASPIAVSSFTMAQNLGGDERLAGQLVIFSSILSIGTMFLFIVLLREFAFI